MRWTGSDRPVAVRCIPFLLQPALQRASTTDTHVRVRWHDLTVSLSFLLGVAQLPYTVSLACDVSAPATA